MWYEIADCRPPNVAVVGRTNTGEEMLVIANYMAVNGGGLPPLITYHRVIDGVAPSRYSPVQITHWRYS